MRSEIGAEGGIDTGERVRGDEAFGGETGLGFI